jgi:hypothetical protein
MSTALDLATDRMMALQPAHIRLLDEANGGALRGLMRALASGSVEVNAEIDALLDDAFVETTGPAGLASLARLVGAPLLASAPGDAAGANRAFIANTVRRRRAKGTARALEGVAGDVTGAGAAVVEYYQRLARLAHLVDVRPERPGLAPLGDGDTRARIGTTFDRTPRLMDMRSIARAGGRHNIQGVGVHVARLKAPRYPAPPGTGLAPDKLAGVPVLAPWLDAGAVAPGYFQISPRPDGLVPLVNPDRRPADGRARTDETMLAGRLRRLPLHIEIEVARLRAVKGLPPPASPPPAWFDDQGEPFGLFLRRVGATTFDPVPPQRLAIVNLATMPAKVAGVRPRPPQVLTYNWRDPGAVAPVAHTGTMPIEAAIDPVAGRVVIADPGAQPDVAEVRLAHAVGLGDAIGAGPQERDDRSVPTEVATADFLRVVDPFPVVPGPEYVATLADALAAWAAGAGHTRGFIVLARCDADAALAAPAVAVKPGTELHIVAAQWRPKRVVPGVADVPTRRGYLVRAGRRYILPLGLGLAASAAPPPGGRPGAVILDGLFLAGPLGMGAAAASVLRVRYCTLRPAIGPAVTTAAPLSAVSLSVEMSIAHSLALEAAAGPGDGTLTLSRTIVAGDGGGAVTVAAAGLDAAMMDVTLLGAARVKTIEATNLIVTGALTAARRQAGCVRYSYLGPGWQAPRRFRCQPDLAVAQRQAARDVDTLPANEDVAVRMGVTPVFLDTDLDQPTAAMLSSRAPEAIRRGGEGGTEMGAFAAAGQPIRFANLASLFDEDLPVTLEGAILDDTRSRATTDRRNVP